MSQLGRYELVAEMARGGMGIVYLAVARGPSRFKKLFVLKELRPELAEDPSFLAMFLEEARIAARLSHPNVADTYEVGEQDGRPFIVMDYLRGVSLARIAKRRDPRFTLGMRVRVLCEALGGLHYAHTLRSTTGRALGIVHRDATPQNVFVTYDGQVKLVDFGIAKAADSTIVTGVGVMKGTPSYMAPEQITGHADARSDIYAIGVALWEAVTGERMLRGSSTELLGRIVRGDLPRLLELVPDACVDLVAIIERALAQDPAERHSSALELRTALEAWLVESGYTLTMQDVGNVVAEIFALDRAVLEHTIDTYLHALDRDDERGEDASLPRLSSLPTAPGSSGAPSLSPVARSTRPRAVAPSVSPPQTPLHSPRSSRGPVLVAVLGALLFSAASIGGARYLGPHWAAGSTPAPPPEPLPPPMTAFAIDLDAVPPPLPLPPPTMSAGAAAPPALPKRPAPPPVSSAPTSPKPRPAMPPNLSASAAERDIRHDR